MVNYLCCQKCGARKDLRTCSNCGRTYCYECAMSGDEWRGILEITDTKTVTMDDMFDQFWNALEGHGYKYATVCSKECAQEFERKVLNYPIEDKVDPRYPPLDYAPCWELWNSVCINALSKHTPKLAEKCEELDNSYDRSLLIRTWKSAERKYVSHGDLYQKFRYRFLLALARSVEAVGRLADAAEIYEKHLKMYNEARNLREKERRVVEKRINVSVDLNTLLQQVKDSGIVVVYRCPHCGGKLKIGKDITIRSLRICEHCGSEIEIVELTDFLKTALS